MPIRFEDTYLWEDYLEFEGAAYGPQVDEDGPFADCLVRFGPKGAEVTDVLWVHWVTGSCGGADCLCMRMYAEEARRTGAKSYVFEDLLSEMKQIWLNTAAHFTADQYPDVYARFGAWVRPNYDQKVNEVGAILPTTMAVPREVHIDPNPSKERIIAAVDDSICQANPKLLGQCVDGGFDYLIDTCNHALLEHDKTCDLAVCPMKDAILVDYYYDEGKKVDLDCYFAGANDIGVINEMGFNVQYSYSVVGPPHQRKFTCFAICDNPRVAGTSHNMVTKQAAKHGAATSWLANYQAWLDGPSIRVKAVVTDTPVARGAVNDEAVWMPFTVKEKPRQVLIHHHALPVADVATFDAITPLIDNAFWSKELSPHYHSNRDFIAERQAANNQRKFLPNAVKRPVYGRSVPDRLLKRLRENRSLDVTMQSVACAYDSDDYSRLVAGSKLQPGFRFEVRTFWRVQSDEYTVQMWVGYNSPIEHTSPTAEGAFKEASKKAVKFCLVQGIPLPDKGDPVPWDVPVTVPTGSVEFIDMLANGATFFPAIVTNSGFDSPHAFIAVPGDYSKLWTGAKPLAVSEVGDFKIFGADIKSDLKLTQNYTFLPVSLALGSVSLVPWSSYVIGNSWEVAVWTLERTKRFIPVLLTGAINGGAISSGAIGLKNELARLCEWRSHDLQGNAKASIVGPGAIIPADLLSTLYLPIENRNLTVDFRQLTCAAQMRVVRKKPAAVVRTTTTTTADKRGSGLVGVTKTTRTTKAEKPSENVKNAFVRYVQPEMQPFETQLHRYVKAIIEPFANSSVGVKIPDTVVYPSNTYRLEMRQDITADSNGNIAVAMVPWHRATLQTSNITNATQVYDWKSGSMIDYTQKAAIEAQFSMARAVAGGIRVRYTGAALSVAGSITGAITDPGQAWPTSYSAVNNLPEFKEYSASAESAGVEVVWKPMTIHDQPYHETTSYPTPAGGSTIWYPYGAGANVGVITRSSWQTADGTGGGPITLERNTYPFLIVAGKGFPAGAPFIVEIMLHFEVVQRLGTLQVGMSKPSIGLANHGAMDQAANVLAQMPAVRKPGEGFIAKATNIVKGMAGLVREGFGVAQEVKSGFTKLLL